MLSIQLPALSRRYPIKRRYSSLNMVMLVQSLEKSGPKGWDGCGERPWNMKLQHRDDIIEVAGVSGDSLWM